MGGQYDETLIQAGTEHDSVSGLSVHSAWYELLSYDSVAVDSLRVSPRRRDHRFNIAVEPRHKRMGDRN